MDKRSCVTMSCYNFIVCICCCFFFPLGIAQAAELEGTWKGQEKSGDPRTFISVKGAVKDNLNVLDPIRSLLLKPRPLTEPGVRPILPVIYTSIPKPTSVDANYSKAYVIELDRFGIKNDETSAVATTNGINNALQYAKTLDINRIIFPAGTYLIDENNEIVLDHQNTVIDFNGATLKVRTNSNQSYKMVRVIEPARNLRLTNGTLMGDRDTHTYTASYESGNALIFTGGSELEVDNMTVSHCTGSGVVVQNGIVSGMPINYVLVDELESGGISTQGTKVANATKTRSKIPYDLAQFGTQFEFGNSQGYQGYPYVTDPNYQAYFYDANMNFIEKKNCIQFMKVSIPSGAKKMHLEFNQAQVVSDLAWCGRITSMNPPREVHFHHNTLSYNRMLNLSASGGQRWIFENNYLDKSGGQLPGFAIDFEDGWEMTQSWVLRKNTFKDNAGDLVVVSGSEYIIEDNEFTTSVIFWGRSENYTFRNNSIIGEKVDTNGSLYGGYAAFRSYSGHNSIHDNHYENSNMRITPSDPKYSNLPLITLKNETLVNMAIIQGIKMKFENSTIDSSRFLGGSVTESFEFHGCQFLNNPYIQFFTDGPPVAVTLRNCTGELEFNGTHVSRLDLQ